jgi:hypothetical protein
VHSDARRLEISVDMQREAGTSLGAERGRGRLTQQLIFSVVLHGDGVASSHNPLDPADGQRQLARAQQQQQQVQSRQQAGGSDPTDHDDVVETPYLHFSGRAGCRFDVAVKIDDRVEGSFEDVQGTVPYVQMTRAEQRRRDDSACALVQAVLDTRDGRLWTHVGAALREVPGVTVRSEKGRAPQRHEGPVALQWLEGSDWLQQRLLKLSSGGEDQARLPAGGAGRVDGQVEMKLRWRFAPV